MLSLAACLPGQKTTSLPPATGGQCAPVFEAAPLNACAGSARVTLTIVGDVLLHWQLAQLGYSAGFQGVWSQAAPYLAGADVAIANLEGPVAPGLTRGGEQAPDPGPVYDDKVYTGFPLFNYHPRIIRDLKAAGVDLVTTANNHAMDRGARGADLTLRELARGGLIAVGTIRAGAPRDFVRRRATALGNISFIACSFSTNGNPDPARQVLLCYSDRSELLAMVRAEAARADVAGVVVLPHWGQEYTSSPDANQRALARDLAAAGAMAVIGTHPHAVQPFTTLQGPGKRMALAYSTGNFIAVQSDLPSKVGAMAMLEVCQGAQGGGLVVEKFGWIGAQMEFSRTAYWLNIAAKGTDGAMGLAERHLAQIAPGFSAQPRCK